MHRRVVGALSRPQLAGAFCDSSHHIPYAAHFSDAVIRTDNGDFLAVIRVAGIHVETLSSTEIDVLKHTRNQLLKGLSNPNIALWTHVVRRRETRYPEGDFPPGYARDLDARWRGAREGREYFHNELYVTVVRRAPLSGKTRSWFHFASPAHMGDDRASAAAAQECREVADKLVVQLARYGAELLTLTERDGVLYSSPLRFLRGLATGEWADLAAPRSSLKDFLKPNFLAFGTSRDEVDVLELRSPSGSRRFGGMLGIREYPASTAATMMDVFLTAPCELVVSQSFLFRSKASALAEMVRIERQYGNSRDAAQSIAAELAEARDDLASSRFAWGEHQFHCLVFARSSSDLRAAIGQVASELSDVGIMTIREQQGLEPAFWAQLPANFAYRTRGVGISTTNLASFASLHAFSHGRPEGNHWGPAIAALETSAGTPYYFNLHVNDVGHGIWIGPNGSGKTVTALFMLAQAQRFGQQAPRTIVFDKDRGAEIAIRALGGTYSVIRHGQSTGWNPFAFEGTDSHKGFLRGFLAQLVTSIGEPLTTSDRASIATAVERMYLLDPEDRQMARLSELIPRTEGSSGIDRRFRSWYGKGESAWLFDNPTDHVSLDAKIVGFDLTTILRDPAAAGAVQAYLFYQVERHRDGQRTLIFVDEGWYALSQASFESTLRDWYKTGRKNEVVMQMATQEAGDALRSAIGQTIIQQSPTHVFFPNPQATREELIDGFKLSEREYQLVTRVLPDTRCFLVRRGNESAVVRFDMSDLLGDLAVLSGRRERVALVERLRAEYGEQPERWLPPYWKAVTGEDYETV